MFICIAPFPTPKFHITAGMYSVCMHSFFQNTISKNSVSIHWNRSAFKVLHFMLSLHCTQRSDTAFLGAKLKIYCNPIRHIMLFVPLRQNFLVKGKSKLWSQKKNPKPTAMSEKCCYNCLRKAKYVQTPRWFLLSPSSNALWKFEMTKAEHKTQTRTH